ncbi:uncharacterized protein PADG_00828 [Paracoccidioides brasiliensis Pb18]|uniref:Uncharacterized protein n=1 Tax=Paracoccidioides brasiliensis (strain Pb18) TaxID=502780 RepID=C1FYF2_PARBD|nr:uncharacterized protein PADG_00828 [Paracoccidioides brasiliensis Pb18]EEH44539.1 hypothetical protein PADG_00828 [Paracoccidioides brasiliensis Pb18]
MAGEGKKLEAVIDVPAESSTATPVVEAKINEQSTTTLQAQATNTAPPQARATPVAAAATKEDEEGSDWEDLDDVLDDFSTLKKPSAATQPASSSDKPISTSTTAPQPSSSSPTSSYLDNNATKAPESDLDENAFIQQLEQGMAELMGSAGGDGEPDWDALAQKMAQGNMDPTDIMKLLMGDGGPGALAGGGEADLPGFAGLGDDKKDGKGTAEAPKAGAAAAAAASSSSPGGTGSGSGSDGKVGDKFQETIRKTMERMQVSGEKATAAATEDGGDDMLVKLLKAMESGAGAGGGNGEESLDKIFMGIMEQLSNKDMLYEPMKELHNNFGPWLEENRGKVPKEDMERYELQAVVVREIVEKFDEEGYSDDKPEHRAYIWEKMQKMQAAGSPPDALVSNPLADELGIPGTLGGGGGPGDIPECPQQ